MKLLLLLISVIVIECNSTTVFTDATRNTERNIFASDIFQAIASENLKDNVILSPAAIQSSMALAYYGANGKTANEIETGLRLGSSDSEDVVRRFGEFQQAFTRDNNMQLGTNIYINENLEFKGKFKDVAQRNFYSNIEKADFHPPYNKRTADRINKAMETKTNGKVTNILDSQLLNDRTEGIIVNGISYTAPWQKAFKADKTIKRTFTSGRQSFQVDTMWTLNNFKYGEFSNLDAKVVELPYNNEDYSMLIILPNKNEGLRDLIQRISGKDLVALLNNGLDSHKVEVLLPKFSVSYRVSLEEPFQKLGVTTMFTRDGDFGNMYRMFVSHYINSVTHKAYLDVIETGTEQPLDATTGFKSLFSRTKKIDVDHPFVFAVKYKDSIIFMGHIANYMFV